MINELRSLLLNERPGLDPGSDLDPDREELADPRFVPRRLDSTASAARAAIFHEADASRAYRHFIATALTRLAYAAPEAASLAGASGRLDPRVHLKPAALQAPSVSLSTTDPSRCHVGGAFSPALGPGIFANVWTLTRAGDALVRIDSQRGPVNAPVELAVSFAGDSSLPLFLPGGGGLFVQWIGGAALPSPFRASVAARVPMSHDPLDLLSRLRARAETGALFGRSPEGILLSPLYDRPGHPHEQLAAVLFAYALSIV
jgi:hypothetical protein